MPKDAEPIKVRFFVGLAERAMVALVEEMARAGVTQITVSKQCSDWEVACPARQFREPR